MPELFQFFCFNTSSRVDGFICMTKDFIARPKTDLTNVFDKMKNPDDVMHFKNNTFVMPIYNDPSLTSKI